MAKYTALATALVLAAMIPAYSASCFSCVQSCDAATVCGTGYTCVTVTPCNLSWSIGTYCLQDCVMSGTCSTCCGKKCDCPSAASPCPICGTCGTSTATCYTATWATGSTNVCLY